MVYDPSKEYMSLINGDFQGATVNDGATVDPSGWTVSEPAGRDHFVQQALFAGPDGSTSNGVLYMRDNANLSGASIVTQKTGDVIQSDWQTITFEFDIKATGTEPLGQGDQGVTLQLMDSGGNVVQTILTGTDNIETFARTDIGNGWQHIEREFTVDPSWTGLSVNVLLYVNDSQAAGGRASTSMLIDNVGLSYEVICFARGTLIETQHGPVSVENLREGDLVETHDNGLQPIRWIGSSQMSAAQLAAAPNIKPIRIRAGALGPNRPSSDLIVSPQHRILVRSEIARRMFSADEVLVAAKHMLEIDGIDVVDDANGVEYFHFMFDKHEIVVSNGAETESLYTGPVALRSVSPEARQELLSLFPEIGTENPDLVPPSARHLVGGRQGRKLATRHHKNHQALVC